MPPGNPTGYLLQNQFQAAPDPFAGDRVTRAGAENAARFKALQGFESAAAEAQRPGWMQQQAGNIASHGTIETPQAFQARTGRETAAEMADPGTALGRFGAQEHGRDLERRYTSNVRPTEIAGQTQRDVASIGAESADYRAGLGVEQDELDREVGLDESEISNYINIARSLPEDHPLRATILGALAQSLGLGMGLEP